jgi:hypothetical protein
MLVLLAACTTEPGVTTGGSTGGSTSATTSTDSTAAPTGSETSPTTGEPATGDTPTSQSPTGDTSTGGTGDTSTGDPGTDTSTGAPAMLPGDVLDLQNWKLTLPVDTDHPGNPDEIEQPELAEFVDPLHYHLSDELDGVVFRAHAGGVTTEGSGYPRSELREMTDAGAEEAAWSSGTGKHRMFIDQRIVHLPVEKPHIVVGQIHDDQDDVIVFRLEGSKLFIDLNGDDGPVLTDDYVLGDRFTVAFEVSDDHVDCYYNDALVYTHEQAFSGAYFKAGAYVQSSCQGDKKVPDESCEAFGEVVIHDLAVTHEG